MRGMNIGLESSFSSFFLFPFPFFRRSFLLLTHTLTLTLSLTLWLFSRLQCLVIPRWFLCCIFFELVLLVLLMIYVSQICFERLEILVSLPYTLFLLFSSVLFFLLVSLSLYVYMCVCACIHFQGLFFLLSLIFTFIYHPSSPSFVLHTPVFHRYLPYSIFYISALSFSMYVFFVSAIVYHMMKSVYDC